MTTANDRAVLNRILNPLLPANDLVGEKEVQEGEPISHSGIKESRKLENEGVRLAESGKVDDAVAAFSRAIEICPVNPSAYNNRAQAYRLEGKVEEALTDLNKAIELSQGKGKSACQALVQRAMIRRLQGDDDKAREDFGAAANLGSSFAKMQAVALNPYAAMCNKMLAQVFDELKTGKQ